MAAGVLVEHQYRYQQRLHPVQDVWRLRRETLQPSALWRKTGQRAAGVRRLLPHTVKRRRKRRTHALFLCLHVESSAKPTCPLWLFSVVLSSPWSRDGLQASAELQQLLQKQRWRRTDQNPVSSSGSSSQPESLSSTWSSVSARWAHMLHDSSLGCPVWTGLCSWWKCFLSVCIKVELLFVCEKMSL